MAGEEASVASIEVTSEVLRVRLGAWERIAGLQGDIVMPRSSMISVDAVPDLIDQMRGIQLPGYNLPSHAAVGTWRGRGFKDFVAISWAQRPGVVIHLKGEAFDRLLLSCPEPKSVVERLYA